MTGFCRFAAGAACSYLALAAALGTAHAQQAAGDSDNGYSANEIVVTANKREQNLSDVGAAITAMSGDDLAAARVTSVTDLPNVTPGLAYASSPNNTPIYTLRGVGFYESSLAAYPDVSLYMDEAPLPLPIMATLSLFDVERVEVLKGPQGTLFGNNATGGAINFIAAKPTDAFAAGLTLGYSRFNTFDAEGFVSGPIAANLNGRFAVRAENGDGWQKSVSRQDRLGRRDNIAGRLLLDWEPSDRLRFSLNLNAWRDQNDPQAAQLTRIATPNPAGSAGLGGVVPADYPILLETPIPEGHARLADWSVGTSLTGASLRPFTDNRFWSVALRADYDLSDAIQLTSLTSYNRLRFMNSSDLDGSPLVGQQNDNHWGSIKSFGQELRLSNGGHGTFRWVVGANFEDTKTGEYYDQNSWDSTSSSVNGAPTVRDDNYQHMTNYAGFANVELDVVDRVTIKAGIRQSKAKRSSNAAGFTIPGADHYPGVPYSYTEFFNIVYGLIYGPGTVPEIQPGQSFVLDTRVNADGSPVDAATYMKTGRYFGKLNEDSTSWSAGLDFRLTDDALLYANVKKGYKSGSFPIVAAAIFDGLLPVTQESLLDYEAGFKLSLADRRVSITGAAFYYDYKDKQLLTKFVDPLFGQLDRLQNVPKSDVRGAEFEVSVRPSTVFSLSGTVTYLDAKVKEYQGIIGEQVVGGLRQPILASFAGVRLPFSAKWQYSLRGDLTLPLSGTLDAFAGAAVHGQSSSYSTLALTPQSKSDYFIGGYALVDASIGVKSSDDRWRATLWGKNIFDKYYVTNRFLAYDTMVRYAGRPAEYGITLSYRY